MRDAAVDADLSPTRRMIANASIGVNVDDAYYSVRELREAVGCVHEGVAPGKMKLAEILANAGGDDFQRCVYFCLAGRGVVAMLDDLEWLEDLLERRGLVAGEVMRLGGSRLPLANPYVADAPDGPLVLLDGDFEQGPSWWKDPTREI